MQKVILYLSLIMLIIALPLMAQAKKFEAKKMNSIKDKFLSDNFDHYLVYELDIEKLNEYVKSTQYQDELELSLGSDYHWKLQLYANDLRSADYVLFASSDAEVKQMNVSDEVITFQGYLDAPHGKEVRMSITNKMILGYVHDQDEYYYIEPLRNIKPLAAPNLFIVYKASDVIMSEDNFCAFSEMNKKDAHLINKNSAQFKRYLNTSTGTTTCRELEVGIAADFSMFTKYGTTEDVINHIMSVFNLVIPRYQNQFTIDIDFVIVASFVATTNGGDPFNPAPSTESSDFLQNFRIWGEGGGFGVPFDLGSLWTDIDITSNGNTAVIGTADGLGGVCLNSLTQPSRYQINEDYTTNMANLSILVAHETGHNFGMFHNNPAGDNVMEPVLNPSANDFSDRSRLYMESLLLNVNCLEGCECIEIIQAEPVNCSADGTTFDFQIEIEHKNNSGNFTVSAGGQSATFAYGTNPQSVTLTNVPSTTTSITATDDADGTCTFTTDVLLPTAPTISIADTEFCSDDNTNYNITATPTESFGSIEIRVDGDDFSNSEQSAQIIDDDGNVMADYPLGTFPNFNVLTVTKTDLSLDPMFAPYTVRVGDWYGDGLGDCGIGGGAYRIRDGQAVVHRANGILPAVACGGNNAAMEATTFTPSVDYTQGGNFTGTGITDATANDAAATFNPQTAGVGQHTISYTYDAVLGCTAAQQILNVYAYPSLNIVSIDCVDGNNYSATISADLGAWNGVLSGADANFTVGATAGTPASTTINANGNVVVNNIPVGTNITVSIGTGTENGGCHSNIAITSPVRCCPEFTSVSGTPASVCNGASVAFSANITTTGLVEGTDYSASWSGPSGSLTTSDGNITMTTSSNCTETQTYTYILTCLNGGATIASETVDINVSPNISATQVTPDECVVGVNVACAAWNITWDDGQGNTGTGNSYDAAAEGTTTGTVTFTINNTSAPAACNSTTLAVPFKCCPIFTSVSGTPMDVCNGTAVNFSATVNTTGLTEGTDYTASWSGPSGSLSTSNGSITMTSADACTATQTYTYTLTCTQTSATIASETVDITVSPTITGTQVTPNECVVGVNVGCAAWNITWDDGQGNTGTGNSYDAAAEGTTAGTVTFTIDNTSAPATCNSTTVDVPFKCCPIFTSVSASATDVCEGTAVNFSATVNTTGLTEGTDYTASWSGPSGSLSTSNGSITMTSADACTATQTYTYTLTCTQTSATIASETVDITVSPDISATQVTPNTCVVGITPACTAWTVTWDDGQGNTGTGNSYDADAVGTNIGTVDFTVTNASAPAGCSSNVIPVDFACCPDIISVSATSLSVCNGEAVSFDAVLDAAGFTEGTDYTVSWSGPSGTIAGKNGTINMTTTQSCTETQTYTFELYCTLSNSVVASETVDIDVSPAVTATQVTPDECVVGVNIGCAAWTVTWDDGQGNTGTGTSYDAAANGTTAGSVTFTINNTSAPATCNSTTVAVPFKCCPIFTSVSASATDVCEGTAVNFSATVNTTGLIEGTDYTASWSGPSGSLSTSNGSITMTSADACTATQTYTYTLTCTQTSATIASETVDITVSPTITGTQVTPNECVVGVNVGCAAWNITWDDGQGNTGTGTSYDAAANSTTTGTVTFTVNNTSAPATCNSTTIDVPFKCCPIFTSVNASATDVCEGTAVNFSATVNTTGLTEGTDYTASWSGPSGSLSTSNGSITMTSADACTATQTYTYTLTCTQTSATIASETVDITVSPDISATQVTPNTCVVGITPACTAWTVTWDDGQGNTGTGNSYDADAVGTNIGTVDFTVTNASASAGCSSNVIPVDFACCPDIISVSATSLSVCNGEAVSFDAVLDAAGFTEGTDYTVSWSGPSGTIAGKNGTINMTTTQSCTETQTYTFELYCTLSNSVVASETVDIDVSPAVTATQVTPDECVVGVNVGCAAWNITWDDGQGNTGTGNSYDAAAEGTTAGTVTFTIDNTSAPATCNSTTVDVPFKCCPIFTSVSASATDVCEGTAVNFSATVNTTGLTEGTDYTASWSGPSGSLSTSNGSITMTSADACTATQTYTYTLTCTQTSATIASETVDITVSPDISATQVTPNTCVVGITPACTAWTVTWDDGQGNTGTGTSYDAAANGTTAGSVTFTINNTSAPATCNSTTVAVPFKCCPIFTSVSASATDVCEGTAVNFSATVNTTGLTEGTDYTASWSGPSGSLSTSNGSITMTSADACTATQTYTYTLTCTQTSATIASETVDITVSPTITGTQVTPDECVVGVNVGCAAWNVTWDDGQGNTGTGNSYDAAAEGTTTGTVTFTINNTSAPAACNSTTLAVPFKCCPIFTSVSGTPMDVCNGTAVNFSATVNTTGLTEGTDYTASWSGPSGSLSTSNGSITMTSADACTATQTYTYTLTCTQTSATIASETVDITVSPTITGTQVTPDECVVGVNIGCAAWNITWDDGQGNTGTGNSYDAAAEGTTAGTVTFTIDNTSAPTTCNSTTVDVPFKCCPIFTSVSASATDVCEGTAVNFSATVNTTGLTEGTDYTASWSGPSGSLSTSNGSITMTSADACTATQTYTYTLTCTQTSATIASETVDITVSPTITGTQVTPDECVVGVNIGCAAWNVTWDDGQGNTGTGTSYDAAANGTTAGSVTFTINNTSAPATCNSTTVDVPFKCCPIFTSVNASATDVCEGTAVNFSATVNTTGLTEGTDYTASWSGPSGSLSTSNGSITMTSADACTATQTYTYTLTCTQTSATIASETVDITVSPTITGTQVTPDECVVGVNVACATWNITWDDGQGNTGTGNSYNGDDYGTLQGTVNFMIENPDAPIGCQNDIVGVDFACCIAEAGSIVMDTKLCPEDDIVAQTNGGEQTEPGYTLHFLLIDNTSDLIVAINTTGVFSGVEPGDYTVYAYSELSSNQPTPSPITAPLGSISVSDVMNSALGCFDFSSGTTVTMPEPFIIDLNVNTSEGDGGIGPFSYNSHEISFSGGTPPYNYKWETEGYVRHAITGQGQINILYSDGATWSVTVTDANGCDGKGLLTFSNNEITPNGPTTILDIVDYEIGPVTILGGANGWIDITVEGGDLSCQPDYDYIWSGPNGFTSNSEDVYGISSGWYAVTVSDCNLDETIGWYWVPTYSNDSGGSSGIRGKAGLTTIQIQPNPTSGLTNIRYNSDTDKDIHIRLVSINGQFLQAIYEGSVSANQELQVQKDFSTIAAGVYFIEVRSVDDNALLRVEKVMVGQ